MKLVWLRNDLRLRDNPALFNAASAGQGVTLVVTLTPLQWQQHDDAPAKLAFWWDCLTALVEEAAALRIGLRVLPLSDYDSCGPALLQLAEQLKATGLHFNREWPLNEMRRDEAVISLFQSRGIACDAQACGDLIVAPGQLRTGQGTPFRVFTPFARSWRRFLMNHFPAVVPMPQAQPEANWQGIELPEKSVHGEYNQRYWPAGEAGAAHRLARFLDERETAYAEQRDFPALPATSTLSPWLVTGAISPRLCLLQLAQRYPDDRWLEGSWLNELVWREFYRHLLVDYPELSIGKPFRPEVEARIRWRDDDRLFRAWCNGETGFPLVDAAMHQLNETGWMHNRLRMLTASFLTKLLRIDWRKGEQYFMSHLIDGDFASNRGGWQWSASVGADAAPYFRIFNPERQQQKFDPQGTFVQHWLPAEKQNLKPIIDYASARKESLELYKEAETV